MNTHAENMKERLTPTQVIIMADIAKPLKEEILSFLSLCHDLRSVIEKENFHLMRNEEMLFDGIYYHKMSLLKKFEIEVPALLSKIKEHEKKNIALQMMLVEEMQNIKRILNINTAFHMDELKIRMQKVHDIRENILGSIMHEKTDSVCH